MMDKNINSTDVATYEEVWEKMGAIFANGLNDSQNLLILLKMIELLNQEISICTCTKDALIEKNNATTYGNKNNDLQALLIKYRNTIEKAKEFSYKIVFENISQMETFTSSDMKTFKLHYLKGVPFNQMYEFIPENDADDDNEKTKNVKRKKDKYKNFSDRSNLNRKLLQILRGFKSQKLQPEKENSRKNDLYPVG